MKTRAELDIEISDNPSGGKYTVIALGLEAEATPEILTTWGLPIPERTYQYIVHLTDSEADGLVLASGIEGTAGPAARKLREAVRTNRVRVEGVS